MMATFDVTRLAYGSEKLQFGDLYIPHGVPRPPVVILIHGGFWRKAYDLSLMVDLAEDLARRGIAAWNIEYRRVGDKGGGWPGTLLDVARATDYVNTIADTYHLDLQRVVAVGHSAGGHLALWLGARHQLAKDNPLYSQTPLQLAGAISQAGAMDLQHVWQLRLGRDAALELLGGSPADVRERYVAASPAEHLPLGIPQVLIHGTEDCHVPFVVSQIYADKARAAGDRIELIKLTGADHFVLIDPTTEAWKTTINALLRLI